MHINKFLAYGRMQFKTSIAYRFQFMSSIVISPIILSLYYFIWKSVFENSTITILGYSFESMITYYVISMITGHFIFNMVGNKMQQKIMYGDLLQDLLKPVSIMHQFLSKEMAERAFAFLVEVLPVFLISFFIFKLQLPLLTNAVFYALALFFSFLLNFYLSFLLGMVAFWVQNIEAIQWLMFIFIRFLSGEFIPLEFLGTSLFALSQYLPFYYLRYGIIQVYLGNFTSNELLWFFIAQIGWVILLLIACKIMWKLALKKFGAQGG